MKQLKPHFEPVIRRWPTVVAFAMEVGCPERSAREWLRNDSIPAGWFKSVIAAAERRGGDFLEVTETDLINRAHRRRHGDEQAAA